MYKKISEIFHYNKDSAYNNYNLVINILPYQIHSE